MVKYHIPLKYKSGKLIEIGNREFIDFQFTQLFFQYKNDLAMKLWGMIEDMVTEVSELFNLGVNEKNFNYAKIGKSICHSEI